MAGDSINQVASPGHPINKTGSGPPAPRGAPASRQDLPPGGETAPALRVATRPEDPGPQVEEAVQALNDYVQSVNRDLQFSVDDASGRTVIKVLDAETQEVVRQIPSEEVLALARHLREAMDAAKGLILETEA